MDLKLNYQNKNNVTKKLKTPIMRNVKTFQNKQLMPRNPPKHNQEVFRKLTIKADFNSWEQQ